MKIFLATLLITCCAAAGAQELRTIPADAKRGSMRHVQSMIVEVDGARARLAAGAQIRGQMNTIVLPAALPPDSVVKYQLDSSGQIKQVWILTPQEAAQP